MHDVRRLLSHMGAYRKDALMGMAAVAVETSLELFIPVLMAGIIDDGIARGDMGLILRQGALMLACAAASLVLGLSYARFASRAAMGLGANLRQAEYGKVQALSSENLDRLSTSSLITRMTTDVTVIQNAVANGFRPMVRGPVMLVMGLAYACWLNLELAGVFFVILPLLALALFLIVRRAAPLYDRLQDSMDALNSCVQEDLTAMRAVKAYVREGHLRARFDGVNGLLARTATSTFGTAALNLPLFQLSMYAAAVLVLWFGGRMIAAGALTVGELTGFMSYVLQIMNSLMMLSDVFLLLTRTLTSSGRIEGVLDEVPALPVPEAGRAVREVADGSVAFKGVSFRYRADAQEEVLRDIDLKVPSGATVGVLGATGSGKSSLVQLIARLYDADAGRVMVGGVDVRDYDPAALRAGVGIALQDNVLFSGTVRENLLWGAPGATDGELLEACRMACADEFLGRMGGLDGQLGPGGAGVSGGQRQRLCIARTLLRRPRVLVFDDSLSAVDMATEAQIRANLAELSGVTVITIAQRITSVMGADMVVVLDDGRVHGVGTHEELLEGDEIYREIFSSQMEFAGAGGGGGQRRPEPAKGAGAHA